MSKEITEIIQEYFKDLIKEQLETHGYNPKDYDADTMANLCFEAGCNEVSNMIENYLEYHKSKG